MKESEKIRLCNKNLHQAFVKLLLDYPVKNVKFSKNKISLTFFGHRISDKIVLRRVNHVGEWSRRRKEVSVDKEFGEKEWKKSFQALCVHEAVERFLSKKYGLNIDNEAHVVARKKEREYLEKVKGNWKSHELKVYWDWHKQGEH